MQICGLKRFFGFRGLGHHGDAHGRSTRVAVLVASISCGWAFLIETHVRVSAQEAASEGTGRVATTPKPVATAKRRSRVWITPVASAKVTGERDRRVEHPWLPPAIRSRTGLVTQYDAKRLTLESRVSNLKPSQSGAEGTSSSVDRSQGSDAGPKEEIVVSAASCVWVWPEKLTSTERAALANFVTRKYTEARRGAVSAVEMRPQPWFQQWLSMLAALAAARSGRGSIALELVRQLDRRPLPPMTLGWLPMVWDAQTWSSSSGQALSRHWLSEQEARDALSDPSPLVRLVASTELLHARNAEASQVLEKLSSERKRPLVAGLAGVMTIQTATPNDVRSNWQAWLKRIEALPLTLQTGPLLMLARKMKDAGLDSESQRIRWSVTLAPIAPHPDVVESLDWGMSPGKTP
ncbi:MAG: hypothetical protein AAF989_08910 [Planctomycetota bacterium]